MPRLIDANSAKASILVVADCLPADNDWMNGYKTGLIAATEAIDEIPTIDPSPKWIPVTERLPENEVDVLICARRGSYKGGFYTHVATAFHTDGKMNTEDSRYNWDIDISDMEYDEEAGAYIVPEGWWEAVRYGEEFSAVDDFVTHWMPLPKPPEDGGAENA